jgi:hypothetical protein
VGKWQKRCIQILEELNADKMDIVKTAGHDTSGVKLTTAEWSSACKKAGVTRQQFYKAKKGLKRRKRIAEDECFVRII